MSWFLLTLGHCPLLASPGIGPSTPSIASTAHLRHNCDQTCDGNCDINCDALLKAESRHALKKGSCSIKLSHNLPYLNALPVPCQERLVTSVGGMTGSAVKCPRCSDRCVTFYILKEGELEGESQAVFFWCRIWSRALADVFRYFR